MSLETYVRLMKKSTRIDDFGNYTLNAGEMNPEIFNSFIEEMTKKKLPMVVWEPFAGTSFGNSSKSSILQDLAEYNKVNLVSFGLEPKDKRIVTKDSTLHGPGCTIGGILFHPPYLGSMPMSGDKQDLSFTKDRSEYIKRLGKVVDNAIPNMVPGGLACVVGRDYRANGERIRLDLIFLQLFENRGFKLKDVWMSTPDVVLILCNDI